MTPRARKGPIRVALCGLGPIGIELGRAVVERAESRRDLKLVGAVDLAPALAGRKLAEVVAGAPRSLKIAPSLDGLLRKGGVDAVALCTSSRFASVAPDLETAIRRGVHVVSSCEELSANCTAPALYRKLDARARKAGVTVLGTGVNPGFVMDRLVLSLAGAQISVTRVEVERVVDAAKRRGPLRKKVGEGLSPAEFRAGVKAGRIGHVGLRQSAELIARGLGWKIDRFEEQIDPEVGADGRCLGVRHRARAIVEGEERILLKLAMFVGAPDPHDRVMLVGDPTLDVLVAGGTQGDRGTIGALVNGLARLPRAARGLVTVADLFA